MDSSNKVMRSTLRSKISLIEKSDIISCVKDALEIGRSIRSVAIEKHQKYSTVMNIWKSRLKIENWLEKNPHSKSNVIFNIFIIDL
jgi:predicted proteasome-type protease